MAHAPYSQLPAGRIRLLQLKPGLPDSPLQAELQVISLKAVTDAEKSAATTSVTSYEAISYCWGDSGFTQVLHLDGQRALPLTESLYSALQSLRYADRSRALWADAVCIDQQNVTERSAQVAIMGDIFSQAQRVVVWLGSWSDQAAEALAFATLAVSLEAKGDRSRDELMQLVGDHLSRTTQCACCGRALGEQQNRLAEGLAAVARLLERPWFERLWVVQEVTLAREVEVYSGSHHASWYNFVEIARVPGQDEEILNNLTATVMPRSQLRQIWARCNYLNQLRTRNRLKHSATSAFRPTGLCNDLLMLSYLKCREPHDRIFGVSKVLGLQGFEDLKADYNLPVAELYRRTVALFLTAAANHPGGYASMMLALVGTEAENTPILPGLPSWVPNLQYLSERSRAKHTYYQWTFAERRYYSDAADFRCKVSTSDANELLIRGRCYGTIDSLMPESCPSKHVHRRTANKCSSEEASDLLQWYARCRKFLLDSEALWTADSTNAARSHEIGAIMSYAFNAHQDVEMPLVPLKMMESWMARLEDGLELPHAESLAQDLRPYITGHPCDRERHLGIVLCEFGTSHAAWLPPTIQLGDKICHFAGAPEPFILRSSTADRYQLQGDAYVHGVFDHMLMEVDEQYWNSLLADLKSADEHLKTWMESKNRTLLRSNSWDAEKKRQLSLTDRDIKETRQQLIAQIREVHRDADERFGWIRIR